MSHKEDCLPAEEGYYFATYKKAEYRCVVLIGKNGFGHMRAFTCRGSSSYGVEAFEAYSERLVDPQEGQAGCQAARADSKLPEIAD